MNAAVLKYLDLYYELLWIQQMHPGDIKQDEKILNDLDRVWHVDMGTEAPGYQDMRREVAKSILEYERNSAKKKLRGRGHTSAWVIEDALNQA